MRATPSRRSALPLLVLGVVLGVGSTVAVPAPAFAAPTLSARVMRAIHGYSGEQLENAAIIIAVAERMGLGHRGAVLGVMTAMGESSLRNIDHGDNAINPDGTVADSIGLFQQQHWWGTRAERMTPAIAAARFFARLRTVAHWQDMAPTAVAHAVQRNADPHFYARFVPAAEAVVAAVEPVASRVAAKHASSAPEQSSTKPTASTQHPSSTKHVSSAKGSKASANALDLPDLSGIGDIPDLPDLSGVGDLSKLPGVAGAPEVPSVADLPDFTDLGESGFGDAVLAELRQSGVALPEGQDDAAER